MATGPDDFDRVLLDGFIELGATMPVPDPLWWREDPTTIEGMIRGELLLSIDKELAVQVDGPMLYGMGNDGGLGVDFDVILVPFKTWHPVPLHEPRGQPAGILTSVPDDDGPRS